MNIESPALQQAFLKMVEQLIRLNKNLEAMIALQEKHDKEHEERMAKLNWERVER